MVEEPAILREISSFSCLIYPPTVFSHAYWLTLANNLHSFMLMQINEGQYYKNEISVKKILTNNSPKQHGPGGTSSSELESVRKDLNFQLSLNFEVVKNL